MSTKLINIDGIGLACGVFEHLLGLEDSPKVLAATHYHEIFENDFLALRPKLQLGHMEVKVCEESQQVEDQVTYLYKFVSLVYLGHNMLTHSKAFARDEATKVSVLCAYSPGPNAVHIKMIKFDL